MLNKLFIFWIHFSLRNWILKQFKICWMPSRVFRKQQVDINYEVDKNATRNIYLNMKFVSSANVGFSLLNFSWTTTFSWFFGEFSSTRPWAIANKSVNLSFIVGGILTCLLPKQVFSMSSFGNSSRYAQHNVL